MKAQEGDAEHGGGDPWQLLQQGPEPVRGEGVLGRCKGEQLPAADGCLMRMWNGLCN